MKFLSERNLELHKEYLNNLMLRYRVFEKSYPELLGADLKNILSAKIKNSEKNEAFLLYGEILAHKLYFSSFGNQNAKNSSVSEQFGSEAQFLYELSLNAKKCSHGFLLLFKSKKGIECYFGSEYHQYFLKNKPILALDLCEHAYFYDYGFDKNSYVINALSRLDLSVI